MEHFLTNYWWIIIIAVILLIIIGIYNKIIRYQNDVKEAKGTIDVYLKQRFDLIPNLVEVVKGYSKHEKTVLTDLVTLRQNFIENNKISTEQDQNNKLTELLGLIENYPELKAVDSYLNLQKQLSKVESELQAARRIYNVAVEEYNTLIQSFPKNLIAKLFGFKSEDFFNISEEEKNNVDVKLGE
jgi:LemA protein